MCFYGANGIGKTNLLDAIYYLCFTKSYFSSNEQLNVGNGFSGFRVEGIFETAVQEQRIACIYRDNKKEIQNDGKPYPRLSDHIGKYPAVMIAPDDAELITDGSELRRKFIDGILSQTSPAYLEYLLYYNKLLNQRNAYLKQLEGRQPDNGLLESFDERLVLHGNALFEARKAFTAAFVPLAQQLYEQIAGSAEKVGINYQSALHEDRFEAILLKNRYRDGQAWRTTQGLHKDDWALTLNDMPLKQAGSQGQRKSFLFAMKLAQYHYLQQQLQQQPLLLLDDVFEKLDETRMQNLLGLVMSEGFGQVFITDTHLSRLQTAFAHCVDQVQYISLPLAGMND